MGNSFATLPSRFGGGLNLVDSPEVLTENEAQVLSGFRLSGNGRISTRKAARGIATVTGDVIGIFPYNDYLTTAAVVLTWDTGTSRVKLYRMDGSGAVTSVGDLAGWTVAARPVVYAATLAQVLFIVDEGKSYGLTCYDPNDVLGSGSSLFQPTFDLNASGDGYAAIKSRLIVEHLNHLWTFGYLDETDQDRREVGRFSYLGLVADDHGNGDAGIGGATGSEQLFDVEDAVPIGSRGVPIIAAASAGGRLVVCSPHKVGVIYGSDFENWRYDQIDDEHGALAGRSMVVADGIAYWMSKLGPCRYSGGSAVEPLERRIKPLLDGMVVETMFAAHAIEEHQVRWYYALKTDSNTIPNRVLAYDYLNDAWSDEPLGIRVLAAGFLRPSGAEAPASAPVAAAASRITSHSVQSNWANGDTSPSVRTEIEIDTVNTFDLNVRATVVLGGVDKYVWGNLTGATIYFYRVRHIRNGQNSSWSSVETFTTLAVSVVAPPLNVAATDTPYFSSKHQRVEPSVVVTFDLGELNVSTRIYRGTTSGFTPTTPIATLEVNETNYQDFAVVAGTTYYYVLEHVNDDGDVSEQTDEESVTPSSDIT